MGITTILFPDESSTILLSFKTKGLQLNAVTHCFCGGEVGIRTLGTLPYT